MVQQNGNPNVKQERQDGKDQPPKMAPDHDNRPQEVKDNSQSDKSGKQATSSSSSNKIKKNNDR